MKLVSWYVQSREEGGSQQDHMAVLELLWVKMGDEASYECLVKPYDDAAVAAIVNFTVYGKNRHCLKKRIPDIY